MTDMAEWHKSNEAYLAAALKWLRLKLASLSDQSPAPTGLASTEPPLTQEETRSGWCVFKKRKPAMSLPAARTPSEPPQPKSESVSEAEVAQAAAEMQAAEQAEPPPALVLLSQRLGLSRFEQQVVLLCTAMELDTRIAALCARAQDDARKPYLYHPTFALALALFDDPAWDALSPERPLRHSRLLEINQPGAQPLTTSALRADERIVNFIKGLNILDDRLASLLTPMATADIQLPPSQQAVVESIVRSLRQSSVTHALPVIQLVGPNAASKRTIAGQVVAALGVHLYRLSAETLPGHAAELETFARLWQRETRLLPVALYLDAYETERGASLEAGAPRSAPLNRFLARNHGMCFLDTREVWPGLDEMAVVCDVANPTPAEQRTTWATALGAVAGESPARLAGQFNLDVLTIERITQSVLAETPANDAEVRDRLWAACLASARPRLESLAQRLEPKATWDDMVLPAEATMLLHQIADQVRRRLQVYDEWGFRDRMNRGLGISVLFVGESGVGKTMAAEVIANDLRLDLYRIDLSAVVSKYIGETEKNLRRLFDAMEDGGAIPFFDEADALFGKRSEVKDSHDRYANIEINYLLQRMEAYRGLAILATNMKSALDTAFTRRLRFIVNFPFPGVAERKLMWQKVFPPQTPTDGLDFGRLARFNLTGASIQSIALNAAFLATAKEPPLVTMPVVLDAARVEFRKLERPISEAEFR
jgi:hypothetical protein